MRNFRNLKNMKISTCKGDAGMTSTASGERVRKDSLQIEVCGELDELCACIGYLVSISNDSSGVADSLRIVQRRLLSICGLISSGMDGPDPVCAQDLKWLEEFSDNCLSGQTPFGGFVLPGGSVSASWCHVCRTVCRRVERRLVEYSSVRFLAPDILAYINRLSDFLFLLARHLDKQ